MNVAALLIALALPAADLSLPDLSKREPVLLAPPGRQATTEAPARIVSLAPVVTETLFLLGRGDRVVGVTRYCDTPAEAQALPKVGGYVDISLERVLSLKPDLVIAMPTLGQRPLLEQLRTAGVPVLVAFGDSLGEVRALVTAVGRATAAATEAERANAALDASLAAFGARLRGARAGPVQRVAVVVGTDPIVVAGPGTFIDEILGSAGLARATAADAPLWPTWSLEHLTRAHVDVLVAAAGPEGGDALGRQIASAFPPERRPRVLAPTRPILMRPGPGLGRDLEALADLLAPPGSPVRPAPGGAP